MVYCIGCYRKSGGRDIEEQYGALQNIFLQKIRGILVNIFLLFSCLDYAQADFRVCNETQGPVGIALGYRSSSGWVSEGWWVVPTAECKTLIDGQLTSRFYYMHAEDAERKNGWNGPVTMCVKDSSFLIEGVHDCFARGFQKAYFEEIDTGNQINWTVQLTGSSLFDNPALNRPEVKKDPSSL
ncbi:DUF1036 domain-containing protein [Bartonella bacilliformis]|uniref:DUF1036 domain-containing protein n=1 Tax=Bartonella bacilliformis Ver097 TaxID=1293911 RepID=A0A072R6T1_BARBA|nr:DUF1036 domain-containing protein [Bartonella bacilliformis]KEG21391.1 hypothetical protein H710_00340 [Bartonella bacilliformis Ver097]